MDIEEMKGAVIDHIKYDDDREELYFYMLDGRTFKMYHQQDCCERVYLEDVCGDFEDICNWPLHVAEERTVGGHQAKEGDEWFVPGRESYTWTFYEFATIKGSVTLRWYGSSNGYYSESVDIEEVDRWK